MLLTLIIDRFEGDKAILKINDNDTVVWPRNKLPENVSEGDALNFVISSHQMKDMGSKQLAKDILNEILNIDNEKK